jgi:hypothetical protein
MPTIPPAFLTSMSLHPRPHQRAARIRATLGITALILVCGALLVLGKGCGSDPSAVPELEAPESVEAPQPRLAPENDLATHDAESPRTAETHPTAELVQPPPQRSRAADRAPASLEVRLRAGDALLASGRVAVRDVRTFREYSAAVDSNGSAHFEGLRPSQYSVMLEDLPSHWVLSRAAARGNGQGRQPEFDVRPGKNLIEIELELGARIEGTVIRADGRPASDARARFYSSEPRERYVPYMEVTPIDGAFSKRVLEGKWIVEVSAGTEPQNLPAGAVPDPELRAQIPPLPQTVVIRPGELVQLDFRFSTGSLTLEGTILDETGAPFSGLHVGLARLVDVSMNDESKEPPSFRQGITSRRSDENGRFAFPGLVSGAFVLYIEWKGYGPMDPPGESLVRGVTSPIAVEIPRPAKDPLVITLPRARPVLVQGNIRFAKRMFPSATVVLQKGPFRTQDHRQAINIEPNGNFSFYVEGAEGIAFLELTSGEQRKLVPLEVSTMSGGPFHQITFPH